MVARVMSRARGVMTGDVYVEIDSTRYRVQCVNERVRVERAETGHTILDAPLADARVIREALDAALPLLPEDEE